MARVTEERTGTTRQSVFGPQFRSVTISNLLLLSLAAFDGMSVVAALPSIGGDLGVRGLPWVLTAFALASTVALLASGPLIDSLGIRRTYRLVLVEFFVSSLLCALAPTLPLLVAARFLQGIGGGMVMSLTLSNVGLTYPPELRPRAIATNSMVWGVMALGGPAVAAFLLELVSWRGVFFLSLPLVGIAGAIGWKRMPDSDRPPSVDVDPRGILMIFLIVVVLLVSVSEPGWRAVAGVAVVLPLALVFWRHTGRVASPVVARRHLARWPFVIINVIPGLLFAGSMSIDAYLPIFVRGGLGRPNAQAAFAVAAFAIGWTVGSQIISRLLDRFAAQDVIVVCFASTIPALVVGVSVYSDHVAVAVVLVLAFFQGLGMGGITNGVVSLLQRAAGQSEMGRASATHQFCREVGGTLGIATAGSVLFGVVASRVGSVEPVRDLLDGKSVSLGVEVRAAVAAGYRTAAIVALGINVISLAFAVYLRRRLRHDPIVAP